MFVALRGKVHPSTGGVSWLSLLFCTQSFSVTALGSKPFLILIAKSSMHLLSLMGIKSSSILLVITLDDINVLLRDAYSSIRDSIEFLVQIFKPALNLLLSHHELLLPAVILLYFVIRSSRMIFLYLLQLIEFSVRLLRFMGNFIFELFWINPRYRLKRAKRYESQANFSLLAIFLRFVEEIISLPIDWICSLGIKGVFAPDPFTESKNYKKLRSFLHCERDYRLLEIITSQYTFFCH